MQQPSNPEPTKTSGRSYQKLSAAERKKLGQIVQTTLPDLKRSGTQKNGK